MVPAMAKQGRPRGLNINAAAVTDGLRRQCISKQELCHTAGITPSHLADMLHRDKGARPETIRAMAAALDMSPETIAPTLSSKFVYVRAADGEPAVA